MNKPGGSLGILHLLLSITETSAPYNEHCQSLAGQRDITICTYFRSDIALPKEITLFEGDDSLTGFFRVLKAALDEKEYAIVHAHTPHVGFLFLVANLIYGKFIRSTVFTMHGSYRKLNNKLRNRLMLIPIFVFFQRVVCCSKASFESFPWFFKRLAGDRICTVQNGIDIDRVDQVIRNNQQCLRNSSFVITTVGRLIEIKNLLTVLRAFHQYADQDSRLVFIGGGPMRDLLMAKSSESGLGKQIELTGLIPREKVYENLTNADLFISASRGEGLPVAVLEAMACRNSVILSDIPPHREIADDVNFIPLVQPDDIAGFAREIDRFRQMSPSERADIGEKCRKLVEERFNLTNMHKGYEKVYAQLMGGDATLPWEIG